MPALTFMPAEKKHAADLAALCDIASHGRNATFWQRAVDQGQSTSVFEIGRQGMLIPGHDLSLEHASVALVENEVVGAVLGQARAKDYGDSIDFEQFSTEMHSELELKALTGGTWYLAVLAIYREYQRFGYGQQLMKEAAKRARAAKQRKMSLIVAQSNEPAVKLYSKMGFRLVETRPATAANVSAGSTESAAASRDHWCLMRRVLTP